MTVLSAVEAYELWAPHYDDTPNPLLALEERVLLPRVGNLDGKRVIDLGCGTGRWLMHAAKRGASSLVGVDASPAMLSVARQQCPERAVLINADVLSPTLQTASADVVLASFVLSYLPSLDAFIAHVSCLLRSGGLLLISDLHPQGRAQGWRSAFSIENGSYEIHTHTYTLDDLREGLRRRCLVQEFCEEPHFHASERDIFVRAGRGDLFDTASKQPAIYVAAFVKR